VRVCKWFIVLLLLALLGCDVQTEEATPTTQPGELPATSAPLDAPTGYPAAPQTAPSPSGYPAPTASP
jgi:hypothetical protein